ncbi:HNH endonuclease [compost metagenome]
MKACSKCKIVKTFTDFSKSAREKDGLQYHCKACQRATRASWRAENPELNKAKMAEWRDANREYIQAYSAKYRANNLEKVKAAFSAWYQKNKHHSKTKCAAWRAKNPEAVKAKQAVWRALNPDSCSMHRRARRARLRQAEGSHTAKDIQRLFDLQRGKCATCRKALHSNGENKFHVDHITPLVKGGSNGPENLQLLCPPCNLHKRAKDPIDWEQENGKLL